MRLLFELKHLDPIEMLPKDRWGVLDLTPEIAEEWAALTETVQSGEAVQQPDYAGAVFFPEFEEPPLLPLKSFPITDEFLDEGVGKSPLEIDGVRATPLFYSAPQIPGVAMEVDEFRIEVRADKLRIISKVQESQYCIEVTPKFLREILPASDNG